MICRSPSSSRLFNHLFLRNNCANQSQFHKALLWDGETKVCSNGFGHMTNMAAMPIQVKTVKNLLKNQIADDLETLYAGSGARVLPSLFK